MFFKIKSLFAIMLIISIIFCKNIDKNTDKVGVIEFQVAGNQQAQDYFKNGLLLLHSFEYEDAREAFLEAQSADPKMAMAYWGEAMTYNHSLWGKQDYEAGSAAVAKVKNLRVNLDYSTIERGFLQAVEVLYTPKPPKV